MLAPGQRHWLRGTSSAWLGVAAALLLGVAVAVAGPALSAIGLLAIVLTGVIPVLLVQPGRALKLFFVVISIFYYLETIMGYKIGLSISTISLLSRWQIVLLVAVAIRSIQMRGGLRLEGRALDLLMLAFAVWTLLYTPLAPSFLAGVYGANALLQFQVAYWTGRVAFAGVLKSTDFLFQTGAVLAVFGVLQPVLLGPNFYIVTANHLPDTYLQTTGSGLPRAASLLGSEGYFGSFLMILLPLALARMIQGGDTLDNSSWQRRGRIFTILAMGAGLIASFHRSSWAGAGIACMVVVLFSRKRLGTLVLTVAVVGAGLIVADQFFHYTDVYNQVASQQDFSANNHLDRAQEYITLAFQHPLGLGLGAAGNTVAFLGNSDAPGIEGGYSQVVLQLGVVGLVLFIAFHVVATVSLLARARLARDRPGEWILVGAAAGVLGAIFFNLFLPFETFNPALMILWLFVGAATSWATVPAKEVAALTGAPA
ncbi:MAG TPA: O-antigen ligase family protein [Candidatus Dormibacteraeota bacterium]|jgi:hypothetical protein|nr:O-antigen ligase family protein [Candidatus Dormibacteraeota bacterium]